MTMANEPIEEVNIYSKVNASNLAHERTIRQWANSHQLRYEYNTWWKDMALVVAGGNNLKRGNFYFPQPSLPRPPWNRQHLPPLKGKLLVAKRQTRR